MLLKIIAFAYEWNYSGRAETVRSALDVLAIACVIPKVQLLFCDRVDLPEETLTVGKYLHIFDIDNFDFLKMNLKVDFSKSIQ